MIKGVKTLRSLLTLKQTRQSFARTGFEVFQPRLQTLACQNQSESPFSVCHCRSRIPKVLGRVLPRLPTLFEVIRIKQKTKWPEDQRLAGAEAMSTLPQIDKLTKNRQTSQMVSLWPPTPSARRVGLHPNYQRGLRWHRDQTDTKPQCHHQRGNSVFVT